MLRRTLSTAQNAVRNSFPRQGTPEARQLVLSILKEEQQGMTTQELYARVAQGSQANGADAPPVIDTLRYLKKRVLEDLAARGKVRKQHVKLELNAEELERRQAAMSKTQKKKGALPVASQDVWRWRIAPPRAQPAAREEPKVFGAEVGVGQDWGHLNRRRRRKRVEKVEADVAWMKELETARRQRPAQ